jgi:hypothetical protein
LEEIYSQAGHSLELKGCLYGEIILCKIGVIDEKGKEIYKSFYFI